MKILAGFAGYVVIFPRMKGKTQNSAAFAKRALGVVKAYYRGRYGRAPATGTEVWFDTYVKEALRRLRKIYRMEKMERAPLLADQIREIRARMKFQDPKEATM